MLKMDYFRGLLTAPEAAPPPSGWYPADVALLAVAIFISAALLNLLERFLIAWKIPNTIIHQRNISLEIADLKHQAASLNHPDTFAQCAKAERKALALEKELARLQERQAQAQKSILIKLPGVLRTVALIGIALLARMYVPVVTYVRPEAVWPLGKWLSLMSRESAVVGAVGLLPWAMLCNRVTKAALGPRRA